MCRKENQRQQLHPSNRRIGNGLHVLTVSRMIAPPGRLRARLLGITQMEKLRKLCRRQKCGRWRGAIPKRKLGLPRWKENSEIMKNSGGEKYGGDASAQRILRVRTGIAVSVRCTHSSWQSRPAVLLWMCVGDRCNAPKDVLK